MSYTDEVTRGSLFWAVFMFSWPYFCVPIAFCIDGKLRARWSLEDVSRPATGYRFKGTNLQVVFTSRTAEVTRRNSELGRIGGQDASMRRSRRLDCTSLWPLIIIFPALFVCAAEVSSGPMSLLFVCTPFLVILMIALTVGQVIILVSLVASPVVHLMYGVVNRGPGNPTVNFMLWSQTFVVLTAVSLAWTTRDVVTLKRMGNANPATATGDENNDTNIRESKTALPTTKVGRSLVVTPGRGGSRMVTTIRGGSLADVSRGDRRVTASTKRGSSMIATARRGSMGSDTGGSRETSTDPEICIVQAAELLLSHRSGSREDEERCLFSMRSTLRTAASHGLPIDTPVLQSAPALKAWREVMKHQSGVEDHIRETHRWGALGEKLMSMNAGMPFMVGIVQAVFLVLSRLENVDSFGSGSPGGGFYASVIAYAVSLAASTGVLIRMLALINRASHGLAAASDNTENAMEAFMHFRSWCGLKHGDIGCLTHLATGKGMSRVLECLVRGGANPFAMDSTGKTPLDIAKEAGMESAREYLEQIAETHRRSVSSPGSAGSLSPTHGGGSKHEQSRSPRRALQLSRRSNSDVGSEKSDGSGTPNREGRHAVTNWHLTRAFAETAARWIMFGKRSSGRSLGKVAAEPLGMAVRPFSAETETEEHSPLGKRQSRISLRLWPSRDRSRDETGSNGLISREIVSSRDSEDGDDGDVTAEPANYPPQTRGTRTRGEPRPREERVPDVEAATSGSDVPAPATGSHTGDEVLVPRDGRQHATDTVADRSGANVSKTEEIIENRNSLMSPVIGPAVSPEPAAVPVIVRPISVNTANTLTMSPTVDLATTFSTAQVATQVSTNLRWRRISSSSPGGAARRGSCISSSSTSNFSLTQSVLNIAWALRRLGSLGTPRDVRAGFAALRKNSPFYIPDIYLLAFADLVRLEEIPRRTGNRFLGYASRRPITCTELVAKTDERAVDPVMVYISHRWLEPEFKNPDNHSKTRFYQLCYAVHKLAKRIGRRSHDFYLWVDYASINQQDPASDRLVLPYVLNACDAMVYIEDDEYWDQALCRTEHFLFHRVRRLRHPPSYDDTRVFSLNAEGSVLTQRTYTETKTRFGHNPARGVLTKETDRLYLWILVLAVTFETFHTGVDPKPPVDGGRCEATGFFGVLQRTLESSNAGYCRNNNEKADDKKSSSIDNDPSEAGVGASYGAPPADRDGGGDRIVSVGRGEGGRTVAEGALNKGETQTYTAEWAQKVPRAGSDSVAPHPVVTKGGDVVDSSGARSGERGSVLV